MLYVLTTCAAKAFLFLLLLFLLLLLSTVRAFLSLSFRAPKAFGVEESLATPDVRDVTRA